MHLTFTPALKQDMHRSGSCHVHVVCRVRAKRRLVQAWSLKILSGSGSSCCGCTWLQEASARKLRKVLGSETHHRPAPVELPSSRPPKGPSSASAAESEPRLLVKTRRLLGQSLALVVHLQHQPAARKDTRESYASNADLKPIWYRWHVGRIPLRKTLRAWHQTVDA